ncbi:atherin-like [Trachypithecus francoisi]|uniref:atherin-like n=1 Tax=Trachypithecus francoisi TaxID=54180 RepID=UPI00141ACF6F|nr:atherin-like [Trachypithecus francoisi]
MSYWLACCTENILCPSFLLIPYHSIFLFKLGRKENRLWKNPVSKPYNKNYTTGAPTLATIGGAGGQAAQAARGSRCGALPPPPRPMSGPIEGLRSQHLGSLRGRWAAGQAEMDPKTRLSSPSRGSSSRRKPPSPVPCPPYSPIPPRQHQRPRAAAGEGQEAGAATWPGPPWP